MRLPVESREWWTCETSPSSEKWGRACREGSGSGIVFPFSVSLNKEAGYSLDTYLKGQFRDLPSGLINQSLRETGPGLQSLNQHFG